MDDGLLIPSPIRLFTIAHPSTLELSSSLQAAQSKLNELSGHRVNNSLPRTVPFLVCIIKEPELISLPINNLLLLR